MATETRVEALHGGDETPFSDDAPEMLWVARAPAGGDRAGGGVDLAGAGGDRARAR